MQKVWELYAIATTIINKLCENKCFHLGANIIEEYYDYIRKRLEKDEFQALKNYDPTKGAKESTYLHTLISSRLIDFFNTAKKDRELSSESSINNSSYEKAEELEGDVKEIVDGFTEQLSFEDQTYLQYRYNDELSYKEIGSIFGISDKQASKKLENIQIKLKRKLEKANYSLEDII